MHRREFVAAMGTAAAVVSAAPHEDAMSHGMSRVCSTVAHNTPLRNVSLGVATGLDGGFTLR